MEIVFQIIYTIPGYLAVGDLSPGTEILPPTFPQTQHVSSQPHLFLFPILGSEAQTNHNKLCYHHFINNFIRWQTFFNETSINKCLFKMGANIF